LTFSEPEFPGDRLQARLSLALLTGRLCGSRYGKGLR